jgi:Ca-activated chloride channel family protein
MFQNKKHKFVNALLLAISLSGLVSTTALADGMIIPFPSELGYSQVDYHRVSVTINNMNAVTRVEQRFSNPYPETLEARYVFPLPPGASIRDFGVELDGRSSNIQKMSGAEAEDYLRQAIFNQRDPSLLQYFSWEFYAVDLSLPPLGSTTMILEYSEQISIQGGLHRYFYTLGTERYSAGPLPEVSLEVDIISDDGVAAIYSPGYLITTERLNPRHIRATYRAENVIPIEHFELFYTLTDQPYGTGLLTHPDTERDGEGHFMLLLSPSSNVDVSDATPKDIVFVIDRSGSMDGDKILQAQNALQFILSQLDEQDRFAIVSFDDRIENPADTLQSVTASSIQRARSYVTNLYARGNTDIESAIQRGLDMFRFSEPRMSATQTIVFLTDGLPTAGVIDEIAITDLVRLGNSSIGASIHVFGVGYDVNTHLLDRIASQNHGAVTYVQPGENLETRLTAFYRQIAHPLMTNLELTFEGLAVEDVYPRQLPDLFIGSSLALVGRYTDIGSGELSVNLLGEISGKSWSQTYHYNLKDLGEHPFVSRLWATRHIGELLDEVRVEGEGIALVEEIEAVGMKFGIVTPYTAGIVEGQISGVASDATMKLYQQDLDGDGQPDINQVSGAATVGARAQNLAYQQTAQANLAVGANVMNIGEKNMAQVGQYAFDLELVDTYNPSDLTMADNVWILENADRIIPFGSDTYFELAKDPAANKQLQAGSNVIFEYNGELIAIQVGSLSTPQSQEVSPIQHTSLGKSMSFFSWLWSWVKLLILGR